MGQPDSGMRTLQRHEAGRPSTDVPSSAGYQVRRALWLLVAIVAFAACATWKNVPPEVVDGRTIEALQKDFLLTAAAYDAAYKAKRMPEEDYQAWREYVKRFQKDIPAAQKAWEKAAMAGAPLDRTNAAKVLALKRELDLMRKLKVP